MIYFNLSSKSLKILIYLLKSIKFNYWSILTQLKYDNTLINYRIDYLTILPMLERYLLYHNVSKIKLIQTLSASLTKSPFNLFFREKKISIIHNFMLTPPKITWKSLFMHSYKENPTLNPWRLSNLIKKGYYHFTTLKIIKYQMTATSIVFYHFPTISL